MPDPEFRRFLSAEEIKECLIYNEFNGLLYHHPNRPRKYFTSDNAYSTYLGRYAGKIAGAVRKDGVVTVSLNNVRYVASRLIWTYMIGEPPPPFIDHRDRDPSNNRWRNLRKATKQQNQCNVDPRGKFKGVGYDKRRKRWYARVYCHGTKHWLGYFDAPESAARAYDEAATQLHGEFARLNFPAEASSTCPQST